MIGRDWVSARSASTTSAAIVRREPSRSYRVGQRRCSAPSRCDGPSPRTRAKGSRSSGVGVVHVDHEHAAAYWGRRAGKVTTVTQNRDFKRVVRARMAQTGETYTAALAVVAAEEPQAARRAAYDAARRDQERLVGRFLQGGRMAQVPSKRKTRAAVLLELLTLFRPGRDYSEPEVNEILRPVHEDVAYLRRELVNYQYLERSGGRYRVVGRAPTRSRSQGREIPEWEAMWLPAFLTGRETGSVTVWGGAR